MGELEGEQVLSKLTGCCVGNFGLTLTDFVECYPTVMLTIAKACNHVSDAHDFFVLCYYDPLFETCIIAIPFTPALSIYLASV